MHRANVAIFLTAVGLIGIAPVILLVVALLRRPHDERDLGEHAAAGRSTLLGVAVLTAFLVVLGGSAAWVLSARGAQEPPSMAGMAGVDGAAGMALSGEDERGASLPILPTLGGLPLTSSVTGSDAVEQVAALHGSDFPVRDAFIGTYGGGRATVWVSLAPDRRTASEQVRTMVGAIAGSGAPFVDPRPVEGRPGVFETTGMGQRHYFFARGDTVWWVASDRQVSEAVLEDVLGASR